MNKCSPWKGESGEGRLALIKTVLTEAEVKSWVWVPVTEAEMEAGSDLGWDWMPPSSGLWLEPFLLPIQEQRGPRVPFPCEAEEGGGVLRAALSDSPAVFILGETAQKGGRLFPETHPPPLKPSYLHLPRILVSLAFQVP